MTFAPESLKAARRYLLDKLDMHPGQDVHADLDPDEVGIVSSGYGDSYHRGKGYIGSGSYSAYFERDRRGLSSASSALDIGEFNVVKGGRRLTLFRFNAWIVAQCEANTPDTRDIREVIYTLDGRTVKRWDRHKRRDSGDSSHLWHTHISYYRDSESHDKTALFRRYVEGTEGDDDMGELNPSQNITVGETSWVRTDPEFKNRAGVQDGITVRTALVETWAATDLLRRRTAEEKAFRAAVLAKLDGATDSQIQAIVADELAKSREIERAERAAEFAEVKELVRQGQSGELAADEVVRLIGERLSATE